MSEACHSSRLPTQSAVDVEDVIPATGNPVQLVRVQLVGVPSTGVVNDGEVIVCTHVNVLAASVLAIVAEVDGKVIVVPSVPARVRVLENVPTFPEAAFTA